MTKRLAMVSLIVLGIVLQNTCPYGFAEKTVVASPETHHRCPMKSHHSPGKSSAGAGDVQDIQKHFKPFTLISFNIESGGQPDVLVERAETALADRYEEVVVPLPMKPPKSGLTADC